MNLAKQQLRTKADLHIARKLWHFGGVVFIIILFHNLSRANAVQLSTFVAMIFLFFDIARQHSPKTNQLLVKAFRPFMRQYEINQISGNSYVLIGCWAIIVIFPKDIVTLCLMFLAVADPLASYAGLLYGRNKLIGQKTLQGSLAAFFACLIISVLFYTSKGIMTERLLVVGLLSGFIGMISELIPIGKLDDNLTFPIICSTLLYGLFYVFGGF